MEARIGLTAGCSTSGRPAFASASAPAHSPACLLGFRGRAAALCGTPYLTGRGGERHCLSGRQRGAGAHPVGRRRRAASVSALFGGLGKLFNQDFAERTRKQHQATVDAINALEPGLRALADEDLRGRTAQLQERCRGGESLDDLLVDAFAVRPSAGRRSGRLGVPVAMEQSQRSHVQVRRLPLHNPGACPVPQSRRLLLSTEPAAPEADTPARSPGAPRRAGASPARQAGRAAERRSAQVVREASRRVLGLRPFDVQLIGGVVLHNGRIAEMRTGEGKTLVAVLPAYLNALSGKGVHVRAGPARSLAPAWPPDGALALQPAACLRPWTAGQVGSAPAWCMHGYDNERLLDCERSGVSAPDAAGLQRADSTARARARRRAGPDAAPGTSAGPCAQHGSFTGSDRTLRVQGASRRPPVLRRRRW